MPGPQGPPGADSTVAGPQGPPGADSVVPGPPGPAAVSADAGNNSVLGSDLLVFTQARWATGTPLADLIAEAASDPAALTRLETLVAQLEGAAAA